MTLATLALAGVLAASGAARGDEGDSVPLALQEAIIAVRSPFMKAALVRVDAAPADAICREPAARAEHVQSACLLHKTVLRQYDSLRDGLTTLSPVELDAAVRRLGGLLFVPESDVEKNLLAAYRSLRAEARRKAGLSDKDVKTPEAAPQVAAPPVVSADNFASAFDGVRRLPARKLPTPRGAAPPEPKVAPALPVVAEDVKEKAFKFETDKILRRSKAVAEYRIVEQDDAGLQTMLQPPALSAEDKMNWVHLRPATRAPPNPGVWAHVKLVDGGERYESMDSRSVTRSADGRTVNALDPAGATAWQSVDGRLRSGVVREPSGAVRGVWNGIRYAAGPDETVLLDKAGARVLIAKGTRADGTPNVVRWEKAGESGLLLPDEAGSVVFQTEAVGKGQMNRHASVFLAPELAGKDGGFEAAFASVPEQALSRERAQAFARLLRFLRSFTPPGPFEDVISRRAQPRPKSVHVQDSILHVVMEGGFTFKAVFAKGVLFVLHDRGGDSLLWQFDAELLRVSQAVLRGGRAVSVERSWFRRHVGEAFRERDTSWERRGEGQKRLHPSATELIVKPTVAGVGFVWDNTVAQLLSAVEWGVYQGVGWANTAIAKQDNELYTRMQGLYTRFQAQSKWSMRPPSEGEVLQVYEEALREAGEQRDALTVRLNEEVLRRRLEEGGRLLPFLSPARITDEDRAYAAAALFGLENMWANYSRAARDAKARGDVWTGNFYYTLGGAGVFAETAITGVGIASVLKLPKLAAASELSGVPARQLINAYNRSVLSVRSGVPVALTPAQQHGIRLLKGMTRAELAVFLGPAAYHAGMDLRDYVDARGKGDEKRSVTLGESLVQHIAGFGGMWYGLIKKQAAPFLTPKQAPRTPQVLNPETFERSGKSKKRYPDARIVQANSEIPTREARIKAAMEQLGVDRKFAEKVANAHEWVPCPIGGCTKLELLDKIRIMGNHEYAYAAIRLGLAGKSNKNTSDPVIKERAKAESEKKALLDWSVSLEGVDRKALKDAIEKGSYEDALKLVQTARKSVNDRSTNAHALDAFSDHLKTKTETKPPLGDLQDVGTTAPPEKQRLTKEQTSALQSAENAKHKSKVNEQNAQLIPQGQKDPSSTIWEGQKGGLPAGHRIDIENPNPGQRKGQIHYQVKRPKEEKYLYVETGKEFAEKPQFGVFMAKDKITGEYTEAAPRSINETLNKMLNKREVRKKFQDLLVRIGAKPGEQSP